MMVWLLFIIGHMGLFFLHKIGSIISIGDLPTTNIIEPNKPDLLPSGRFFCFTKIFVQSSACRLVYKRFIQQESSSLTSEGFLFLSPYLDILKYVLRLRFLALEGKTNQLCLPWGRFFSFIRILA